jgi:hypothetical protein
MRVEAVRDDDNRTRADRAPRPKKDIQAADALESIFAGSDTLHLNHRFLLGKIGGDSVSVIPADQRSGRASIGEVITLKDCPISTTISRRQTLCI